MRAWRLRLAWVMVVVSTLTMGWWSAPALAAMDTATLVTASGRHVFRIELAATDEQRAQGLMFRTELAPDAGMLFDFKRDQEAGFWMKNTYISLDMIFVRSDGRIMRIAENTTPLSERLVSSNAPVRFVLEVIAGTSKRIGLKAGDTLEHPLVRALTPAP